MDAFAARTAAVGEIEAWVDGLRPGDVLLHARRGAPGERRSLRFRDPVGVLTLAPDGDARSLLHELDAALRGGRAVAGYLSYEAGADLVGVPAQRPPAYPLAWFGVYAGVDVVDPGPGGAPLRAPREAAGTLADVRLEIDAATWSERVAAVREALAAGDSYQVNLTTAFRCRVGDVREAYRALSAAQPVPFGALIDAGGVRIASCSPELFVGVERDGGLLRLTTRPMKGTAPRRADPANDAATAAALRADPKSRAENVMIVDLLRHDLGRLARPGSVRVERLLDVEPYRSVWQMTSTVVADAPPTTTLGEILNALFPCGSITGAPKRRTMELIAALEEAPRGVYTGAIGFALPGADGGLGTSTWSVAIRTLVAYGAEGRLGVGGGILIDSDAAAEYDELRTKGRFLSHPKPPLALFETMRWEAGELRRWPRHRARMAASAVALGLPFDASAAEAAVADTTAAAGAAVGRAVGEAAHALRVRLELREDGTLTVDVTPHDEAGPRTPAPAAPPTPGAAPDATDARAGEPLPVVVWSDAPIAADDPARRHKTLDRALYDEASAWARTAGVADVLFLNEHGRVAEGAISNLFVLGADGRWRTPPVADGALPGVLRAELIERGEAVEAPLWPVDLRTGTVAIGSALRGLRRVRVATECVWRHGSAVASRPAARAAGGRP
jgi:para-aminobenzoate synthetase/4-amino-4-deoxychorismate lyase